MPYAQEEERYDHRAVEKKWQARWQAGADNRAEDFSRRPKAYLLFEFPYPSGDGLHVGHVRPFTAMDVLARTRRLQGQNVLFPIGWDAFGLPTENYAIKNGIHPRVATDTNIATFRRQMQSLGLSLDWSREIDTTDPSYYRWTQWVFLQLFKRGLAYQATIPINWCPKDKIGLANEEVMAGKCERCGTPVTRKLQKQWMLKITAYADRLLKELDMVDYPERIKTQQVNWIGRSEGAEIDFRVETRGSRAEGVKRYVLLHGYTGFPEKYFFPWLKRELEKTGAEVIIPALPDSAQPTEEDQVGHVLKNIPINEQTVLFGHSLGAVVAMKVVEKVKTNVAGLVLAGGFTKPRFKDHERSFTDTFSWNFDFATIRKKAGFITILSSTNDYAVPIEEGQALARTLNAPLVETQTRGGHFTGKEEPVILNALAPSIKVFTTRPDTIFGATYVVLAPEHPLVAAVSLPGQKKNVAAYVKKAAAKSDLERTDLAKEKTGVFTGAYAINPANNEKIPIWVADYVLLSYGTGAIMAVPAHDERDFAFAKKFGLPIREVIAQKFGERRPDAIRRDSAAAVVVKNGKVLVLFNRKYNYYDLVSGGYEESEAPEDTIRREMEEETGYIDIDIKDYLGEIEENFLLEDKSGWRQKFRKSYLVELRSDRQGTVARKPYEAFEVQWLEPEDAIKKYSQEETGIAELVRRSFQEHKGLYTGEGTLVNSGEYDGEDNRSAVKKIIADLEKRELGKAAIQYKLRDWVFSRQHYWGEPIPIIHCPEHGAVSVPEDQLPLELPHVEKYQPTDTGESPLAAMTDWVNTICPTCGKPAKRETDTMPNWAGSSWYFLRYTDPKNDGAFAEPKKLKYWLPVDLYEGGMEHTTLHLLYSRFWHKFLFDEGLVPTPEPYAKRRSHGLVLAEDGRKMSKSFGNVINPDELVEKFGADSLRLYEMFMGPFEDAIPWSTQGLIGVRRFVEKVWRLQFRPAASGEPPKHLTRLLHQTIRKVSDELEAMKFNTVVSSLMILANALDKESTLPRDLFLTFLRLLNPLAPHLAAELWERVTGKAPDSATTVWPTYDPALAAEDEVEFVIQIAGKRRESIRLPAAATEADVLAAALASERVKKYLSGKPSRTVFVPGKLLNLLP